MATTFAAPAYAASALPGFRPRTRPKDASAISARDTRSRGRQQVARRDATAPSLRMTRRGRLVVLAVALMVVLLPGAWRAMATAQVEGPVTVAVTVQPGDTLWGIAAAIDPGADPRALIAEIRELNAMTQSGLVPGQVLVVPAG
jgi:nucleoid-associated protein YgaU